MGDISPSSPDIRRCSLPGSMRQHRPVPLEHRPGTVPVGACRGGGDHRSTPERDDAPPTEARPGDLGALEQEEWVKASWKKGERREEIKVIAEASGLTFDDARIVALRLYNHFNWLPQLQERSEQLLAVVGRERRLSLSVVRKEALAQAARGSSRDSSGGSVGGVERAGAQHESIDEDGEFVATAQEGVFDTKDGFNRYIRGLCVVCNEGTFDQMLDLLFRAYSVARDDRTITRNEMAAILAKHVLYEDSEDPTVEKERVYRWLKRQFIHLTTPIASTTAWEPVVGSEHHRGVPAAAAAAVTGRDQDGGFISWDSARELLRRGPQCLENSLAIDLPCLSKDLWSADLVDVGRTHLSSSLQ